MAHTVTQIRHGSTPLEELKKIIGPNIYRNSDQFFVQTNIRNLSANDFVKMI